MMTLCRVLVVGACFTEIKEKGMQVARFWKLYKEDKAFCTNVEAQGVSNSILDNISLDLPLIAPVIAR